MKQVAILFLLLFFSSYSQAQKENIEQRLSELPDISFERIKRTGDYEFVYILKVRQPLDHFDTTKGFFHQKVYLSHKSYEQPTVMYVHGYQLKGNGIFELTSFLEANQIAVEHRYFGQSMPDSVNYNYLNLKQVTADLHHIRQLFNSIYTKKWVSTGISKGGGTTIFYRYFYT